MLLSPVLRDPLFRLFDLHHEDFPAIRGTSQIKVDIRETDKDFQLLADVPGVSKEDINVEFKDGLLSINVETKNEKEEKKDGKVWRSERSCYQQQRSFKFDTQIDAENIAAKYENGVLSLTLPKLVIEDKKTSKILIN